MQRSEGLLTNSTGNHMSDSLKCLDELITGLRGTDAGERSMGSQGLLSEHLLAARRNLLGSMPGEYRLSLREAKKSVDCMAAGTARIKATNSLQGLIDASGKIAARRVPS
jgi:hypothetical protein